MTGVLPGFFSRWLRPLVLSLVLLAPGSPALAQTPSMNVGGSLGTASIGEYQYGLVASGGTGPYSWSIVSGALPPGLALRTDNVPSWFPPGSTAGIVGIATTPGTYTFTIRVTDSLSVVVDQPTTLKITAFTVRTGYQLPDAVKDIPYSQQLTTMNAAAATTWTPNSPLPAGLSLSSSGLVSGTPTTAGGYGFGYCVTDTLDTICRGNNLNVLGVAITSDLLPNATQNVAYGPVAIAAVGGNGSYTFTGGGGLPGGITMNAAGVVSGTTNWGPGKYRFTVTVTDGLGATSNRDLALVVVGVPKRLPSVQPYGNQWDDCTVGVPCGPAVSVNGGSGPFSWAATGLPSGMSIALPGGDAWWISPGDGAISGVPSVAGDYTVVITVTDGDGKQSTNSFPLHVSPLANRTDWPNPHATIGVPMDVAIRVIGGSTPYSGTLVAGRLPEGVSLNPSTLRLTGTPVESGSFNATFLFTDSSSPQTQTLRTTVYFNVNSGGGFSMTPNGYDAGSWSLGSFFSLPLSGCCAAGYTWSVASGTLPPGVSLSSGGLLSGTMNAAGQYTFVIQVADSGDAARRAASQFKINVTSLWVSNNWNLPNGFVGTAYSTPLTTTGATGAVTFTLEPGQYMPPGLSLVSNAGSWSVGGNPTAPGYFGFNVRATDAGTGQFTRAFLSVSIYPTGVTPPVGITSGPNYGTWSIGQVESGLYASGGNGTFAWSVTSGGLPTGMAIRTPPDLAPWLQPTPTGELGGIATAPATYNFTLRATSGTEQADRASTLKVVALRSTDQYSLPDAFKNVPYSYQLGVAGNSGTVTFAPNGTLPAGLSLSPGGVLSGTPTQSGFFGINYTLTDGPDTVGVGRSLGVFDIHVTTAGELPNATPNFAYGPVIISATGGTGPGTYTFSASSLPGGLLLNSSTGAITGAMTGGGGKYNFTVSVTDATNVSYSKRFSIALASTPVRLPMISAGVWNDCSLGIPCARTVNVNNGGTAPFTWSASGLPPGTIIRSGSGSTSNGVSPGDAEIAGVPGQVGTFPVTVTVTEAGLATATNTFPLTVSPLHMPYDFNTSGTRGLAYNQHLRVIGGIPPYTSTIVAGALPAGLTYDSANRQISGTPLENGNFNFTLLFTDSIGQTLRTSVGLNISGGTTTITINDSDLGTARIGQSYSRNLSACCSGFGFNWTFEGAAPAGLSLSASGQLTGSAGGVLSGSPGPVSFLVKAADNANAANYGIKQLTLTLTTLSITTGQLPYGNVGSFYSQTLTATDNSGPVTWTLSAGQFTPPGVTLSPAGVLSGTPTAPGQFDFQVKAADTGGNIAYRSFGLAVYPTGAYPPLFLSMSSSFTSTVGVFTQSIGPATGGVAPYTFSLTPSVPQVPGMRLATAPPYPTNITPTTPAFYMGVIATPGVYTGSIRVTDSASNVFDRPFTITVPDLQFTSNSNLPRATVGVGYFFAMQVYGGGPNYLWSAPVLPAGLAIDPSTGQITGTPTASGNSSYTVTVQDLTTGLFRSRGFSLPVDPFAIATSGALPPGSFNPLTPNPVYSTTLSAPNCGSPCTWSTVGGALPNGFTLQSTGELSGTPTGFFMGTFTVRASGPGINNQADKIFSLVITSTALAVPAITTGAALSDTTVGPSSYSATLNVTGGVPPYAWSLETGSNPLPPGIALITSLPETYSSGFAPGMAYLAGSGTVPGVYTFTLRVTDNNGKFDTRAFTLNVSRLNFQYSSLPFANGQTPTLVYNQAYTQPLLVVGGSGSYPTWTNVTSLPPGLSLNGSTGVVSGTPTNTGTFSNVGIQAVDSSGNSITQYMSFFIAGPTLTALNLSGGPVFGTIQVGSSFTTNVTPTNGTGPYTMTAMTALPPGFDLVTSAQGVIGAPNNAFSIAGVATSAGTFTFTLQGQDSLGNIGVRTYTLPVLPVNFFTTSTLPDATNGVFYSVPLTAFTTGVAPVWTLAPGAATPAGLTLASNGLLSGTPTTNGTFTFTARVGDGSALTTSRNFTLKVTPLGINSVVGTSDPGILPTATTGAPYTYTFTGTGGASVWTFAPGSAQPGGLILSAGGILSGTPTGQGTFSLIISAANGPDSLTRRFTLPIHLPVPTVLNVPAAGTALGDLTIGQNTTITLSANSGKPPYTWAVAAGSSLPPGLSLVTGAALTTFAPGTYIIGGLPTTAGTYNFDLLVTDSAGTVARRTYKVRVSQLSLISGTPPTPTIGTAYSARFGAVGGTGPYTFTALPTSDFQDMLPQGLTLSSSGLLSGTPASTGGYSFRLRVEDSATHVYERAITVGVNGLGAVVNGVALRITTGNAEGLYVGSGRRTTLSTTGGCATLPTPCTYAWSHVGGALPPGMLLLPNTPAAGITSFGGAPSVAGTYTFTVRATDNTNASNNADRFFTYRVGVAQIVAPPAEVINIIDVPSAQVGTPYSFQFKAAGGTPPYTFAQYPFEPLPAGLTLAADGTLSGTPGPGSIGLYGARPVVTDALGHKSYAFAFNLYVTPAGMPAPLTRIASGLNQASVGVPYAYGLDLLMRGGTRPFSWTVAPGSTLPAGMALVTDGTTTYLGGTPTTPSGVTADAFSLSVTDSGAPAQVVTLTFGLRVSALGLSPDTLPPGVVGTLYSQALVPSGGTAPYTVDRVVTSSLPPGLSFSGGILSGTPTSPGNFNVVFTATDSAGTPNLLTKVYTITIDNAAGEAPAVSLAPRPVQIYYETGSPNPAPIPLSIASTSGAIPFTMSLAGIPGASLSASGGTIPAIVNLTVNAASLAIGTYTGVVSVDAPASANLWQFVPVTVTVAAPPPCTYTLNPTASSVGTPGSGAFSVSAASHCAWTAVPSDAWLTITAGASGLGNDAVSFDAAANLQPTSRDGTVTVRDAALNVVGVHTVTQFGTACSFAVSPLTISATSAGGAATVNVTASGAGCAWTASSSGLLTPSPLGGTGNGQVQVLVPPNTDPSSRQLAATIAGYGFTVNQGGIDCTVSLSPYSASAPAAGTGGSVDVTTPAGCSYDTVAGPSWISATSGGSGVGSGTLVYEVEPNSTTVARSGTLSIGGQTFQVNQAALACSVTIGTGSLASPYDQTAGGGSIGVTTNGTNCNWTASSDVGWAHLSPASGMGNGAINVSVDPNAALTARNGMLTISGQTVGITQSGINCSYALESNAGSAPATGGNGSVRVIAASACLWTSASNPSWLTITSSGSQGTSEVGFLVGANGSASPRIGTLTIAGLTYTVTQAAAACAYTVTPPTTSPLLSSDGAAGQTFGFTSNVPGCAPAVVSYADWLTASISFAGTSGTVTYSAAANPYGVARNGTLQVGNATFTAQQTGASCSYGLNAYGRVFYAMGGSDAVLGTATAVACVPAVGTDQPSFILLEPLTGPTLNIFTLPYTVSPFPTSLTSAVRFGTIAFGGRVVYVKQFSW